MAGICCSQHRIFTAGCHGCQYVDTRYNRRRRHAIAAGTWQHRVPSETIRTHITQLRAQGMTINAIARAATVAPRTIRGALKAHTVYVHGTTAAAILAVTPHPTPPAGMVDATVTTRRIQALVALGHPLRHIATMLDRHHQQVWEWAWAKQATVTAATANHVATLYARLEGTPGPSVRARNAGRRNNWPPPHAWDDIDDLNAQPATTGDGSPVVDEVLIQRALGGDQAAVAKLSPAERTAAVHQGLAQGISPSRIGNLLGTRYTKILAAADQVAA